MFKKSQNLFFQGLLFLSGAAALIYQVVWQRALTQAIGVDNIAIVFIVTIFMLGLGFGSLKGGSLAKLPLRKLPTIYAAIELAIGAFGIFSLELLRGVNTWFQRFGFNSIELDFLLNCTLLFVPIFLMGMTTPIAIQILKDKLENLGDSIGRFYGANVLGAAAGSLLTVPLIELVNLRGALFIAVALNLIIGVLFILSFRWSNEQEAEAEPQSERQIEVIVATEANGVSNERLYAAAFCFGFANLAVQIIAFRLYINFMTPVSYLFAVALSAYLLLMALGQSFGGAWIDRLAAGKRIGFVGLLVGGVVLSFVVVMNIPFVLLDALRPVFPLWRLEFIPVYAIPVAFLFVLPAFFSSAFLPVLARMAARSVDNAGSAFGTILFWSTVGNIAGAFIVGLVLFQLIGVVPSVLVTSFTLFAGLVLLGGLGDTEQSSAGRVDNGPGQDGRIAAAIAYATEVLSANRSLRLVSAAALAVALLICVPRDYFRQSFGADRDFTTAFRTTQPVISLEGRTGVTSLYANRDLPYRLEVRPSNSGAAAVLTHDAAVYYRYYSLAAPMALDASFRPRRILQIGMGSGEFPFVAKELPFLEHFDMVELVPEVFDAYKNFAHPAIRETTQHPKVKFHITDGRRFIQKALARGEKYDFIEIGVTGLATSGISNMYSADLFKDLRKLLNPGGYVAVEPYIAHARLLFEFFPYSYQLDGSSWLFFHDKPIDMPDGASAEVDELTMRMMKSTRLSDTRTPLAQNKCETDSIRWVPLLRERIVPRFDSKLGTDNYLPFEYFFLSQYQSGFYYPAMLVSAVPGLLDPLRTFKVSTICRPAVDSETK